jgi:hypothetical protein
MSTPLSVAFDPQPSLPFEPFALSNYQAPTVSLITRDDASLAETNFSLATPSAGHPDTVEPAARNMAIVKAADDPAQSTFKGDGPVALALAAARDSRHRRAAAVAAATAAAAASLATSAALKKKSTEPVDAHANSSVNFNGDRSVSENQTSQKCSTATEARTAIEARMVPCPSNGSQNLVATAEAEVLPPASTGLQDGVCANNTTAAPSSDASSALSFKPVASALSNDSAPAIVAAGTSSAAAEDGIIMWSHMEKDKRVHLNDFLANRSPVCSCDVVLFQFGFDARSSD